MRWRSAITTTLMITTEIMAYRQPEDAERHPNKCSLQIQNNEIKVREKKNQTPDGNWIGKYKPTMTRCRPKTGNTDNEEINSGGQITVLKQGRTGRGQNHPLTLTTETKTEEATLQPMALTVLTSLALLHWILGLMTLILTTRRMQSSSSNRRRSRRPGQ